MSGALSPQADAYAVTGSVRAPLSQDESVVLPSGPIVLDIRSVAHSGAVRLDGRLLPVALDASTHTATAGMPENPKERS